MRVKGWGLFGRFVVDLDFGRCLAVFVVCFGVAFLVFWPFLAVFVVCFGVAFLVFWPFLAVFVVY
ncbi:hypothetical protein C9419_05845 [Paraburkholderia fungorum]|nr:hypothetical protein C9419_05845 [Paraburkholderia fungorum]